MLGDRPTDLPDLRLWLHEQWKPGREYYEIAKDPRVKFHIGDIRFRGDREVAKNFGDWERSQLEQASLWWVSAEMVDLLLASTASVPDGTYVSDLNRPMHTGLVVFEKPWLGTATDADDPIEISAMLWGQTRLPPVRPEVRAHARAESGADPGDGHISAVSTSSYIKRSHRWVPVGRSDWPIGDPIETPPWANMSAHECLSFVEDRRVLAALWTLVTQRGLAETTVLASDRATMRRSERAGYPKVASIVRVVKLRHVDRARAEGEGSRVNYSHRWVVSPHWRLQPYGPGRSQRRLTYIPPHVKGPADKPLVLKEQVNAWVR